MTSAAAAPVSSGPRSGRHASGRAMPRCPLRPGEPCSLCVPGATGPQDCPTVRLVMEDPELREMLHAKQLAARGAA